MENPLPEDVERLIAGKIDSVTELEALLMARQTGSEPWSADTIARRLYVDAATTARVLENLCGRGLLARSERGYAYGPATPELRAAVDRLAAVYVQELIAVTRRLHAKADALAAAADPAKAFAGAFRLRKDN